MDEFDKALIDAIRVVRNWGRMPPNGSRMMQRMVTSGLVRDLSVQNGVPKRFALTPKARVALIEADRKALIEAYVVGCDHDFHELRAKSPEKVDGRKDAIAQAVNVFLKGPLADLEVQDFPEEEDVYEPSMPRRR